MPKTGRRGYATSAYHGAVPHEYAILLQRTRKAAGLTQAELAKRAGVARTVISLYETGEREPGAEAFLRLIRASGGQVSVDRFDPEQIRRGRVVSDLLLFAEELPHHWPGDVLEFPSHLWLTSR